MKIEEEFDIILNSLQQFLEDNNYKYEYSRGWRVIYLPTAKEQVGASCKLCIDLYRPDDPPPLIMTQFVVHTVMIPYDPDHGCGAKYSDRHTKLLDIHDPNSFDQLKYLIDKHISTLCWCGYCHNHTSIQQMIERRVERYKTS